MGTMRKLWITFIVIYLASIISEIFFGRMNNFMVSFILLIFTPIISMVIPILMQLDYSVKLEKGKVLKRTLVGLIPFVILAFVNWFAYSLTVVTLDKSLISVAILAESFAVYLAAFVIILPLKHSAGWTAAPQKK